MVKLQESNEQNQLSVILLNHKRVINQLITTAFTSLWSMELVSTFGGPECRLALAGEGGKESRFLTEASDPWSAMLLPFSVPKGENFDLAFAERVLAI